MSIDLERFSQLKREVEKKRKEADHAEGKLSQLKADLKKEFDCTSLKQADTLLTKLKKELEQEEQEYEAKLAQFEERMTEHG